MMIQWHDGLFEMKTNNLCKTCKYEDNCEYKIMNIKTNTIRTILRKESTQLIVTYCINYKEKKNNENE